MVRILVAALLMVGVMLSGCTGEVHCSASQNPSGQVSVCNGKNSFSYAYQAAGYSKQESFMWENTMGKAQVSWGSQLMQGTAALRILDAEGHQVYQKSEGSGGQTGAAETTQTGAKGSWAIELSFTDVTGQIGITLTATP